MSGWITTKLSRRRAESSETLYWRTAAAVPRTKYFLTSGAGVRFDASVLARCFWDSRASFPEPTPAALLRHSGLISA
jgi:hypothetical protein